MAVFMDIHTKMAGATPRDVADAHQRDVEVGKRYGVTYRNYWFDQSSGRVFCLIDSPDRDLAVRVHTEAHGLVADEILPVIEG